MKKITIIAYSAFLLIMLINLVFYNSLYKNQIEYSVKLLDRQARIVGSDIDNTSMYIVSDLTEINFSDDISLFFSDDQVNERAKGKIKLYYSRYEEIIVGIMLYNNAGDVYTLFKDEERNSWLDGSYRAQSLPRIYTSETLENERGKFKYYLPVIKDGQVIKTWRKREICTYITTEPGVYRVEVFLSYLGRRRGWIYSNPIYVRQ